MSLSPSGSCENARAASGGRVALGAGCLEFLARERECLIFVEVAALAGLREEAA